MFQSTRQSVFPNSPKIVFQSTRPRGARLLEHVNTSLEFLVSIHAPARGATSRATGAAARIASSFNPRARAGRDLMALRRFSDHLHVSIHAPARGAT